MGDIVHCGVSGVRWDRYRFQKKHIERRYAELVFSYLVGSAGHIVHCCSSGAQNVDAQFFLLGWDRYGLHKNASGYLTLNLCFCIRWYLWVM
jgi:hypothetical protein